MNRINTNDPLATEYLVIKLTQKERELKGDFLVNPPTLSEAADVSWNITCLNLWRNIIPIKL